MTSPVGDRRGSGGPWEDRYGYSRVVRVGPCAMTAGCTSTVEGAVVHPDDAGAQTRVALGIGLDALEQVGIGPHQVIATRMYIVDRADAIGAAHGILFGAVRPAATMVIVAGLLDPEMRVEIELQAWAD